MNRENGTPGIMRIGEEISYSLDTRATGVNNNVLVVGSSGSGKTTLLNLIGGLEYPTHGVVYVDDVDITQLSAEEQTCFRRQHIGFIFQKYNYPFFFLFYMFYFIYRQNHL